MIPGWLNSQGARSAGGGASTPQAAAFFAAMTVKPDGKTTVAIDRLISTLVKAGIWGKLIYLHLIAIHDAGAAVINAAAPNGPKGAFLGNGTAGRFAPGKGFTSSSDGGAYFSPVILHNAASPNDYSWGFVVKELVENQQWFAGIYTPGYYLMAHSRNDGLMYLGGNAYIYNGSLHDGYIAMTMPNGTPFSYINGKQMTNGSGPLNSLLAVPLTLGTSSGDYSASSAGRFLADFLSKALSTAEHDTLRFALDTYFKAIGAY